MEADEKKKEFAVLPAHGFLVGVMEYLVCCFEPLLVVSGSHMSNDCAGVSLEESASVLPSLRSRTSIRIAHAEACVLHS